MERMDDIIIVEVGHGVVVPNFFIEASGPSTRGYSFDVRATLHPDALAALELSIARTRVLDCLSPHLYS